MKLSKVCEILEAKVICGDIEDVTVASACGSDMMSDVLAFVKDQGMLLTGLVNAQVIRTAEMMDMHVIAFVRGKKPDDEMIKLAQSKNMVLMCTGYPMYIACGKLYEAGISGGISASI